MHGHSYGGYLSALYTERHPERIAKLFLNSPVGTEPEPVDRDPLTVRYATHKTTTTKKEYDQLVSDWP